MSSIKRLTSNAYTTAHTSKTLSSTSHPARLPTHTRSYSSTAFSCSHIHTHVKRTAPCKLSIANWSLCKALHMSSWELAQAGAAASDKLISWN